MSPRIVLRLGAVLIVLALVAVWSSRSPTSRKADGPSSGDALLRDLDLNAVAAITIASPQETVSLARRDGIWVAASLFDYPADFEKIRTELLGLSELEVGQTVRGGDELLEELGLTTNAVAVTLHTDGGEQIASLLLGTNRMAQMDSQYGGYPDGQYVRTPDGPVVIVPRSLSGLAMRSIDWVDTKFVQVPAPDIEQIRVASADGEYTLTIGEGNAYDVDGMGEEETVDSSKANRLRSALNYLTLQGIADPALSDTETGMETPARYEARTKDSFTYAFDIGSEAEEGRHVRLRVSYDEPEAPSREDAVAAVVPREEDEAGAEEEADPVAAKLEELIEQHNATVEAARKKLEELSRFASWTFVVSTYNADSMAIARGELVQPKEEPEAEDSQVEPPLRGGSPEVATDE